MSSNPSRTSSSLYSSPARPIDYQDTERPSRPVEAEVAAPVARVEPRVHELHGESRIDDYFWLRDRNDPEVIAYLEAENEYSDAWFAERDDLVETIFGEIKSRIQETDIAAPVKDGPWWYTSRTEEGRDYAIHCRGRSAAVAARP